MTTQIEPLLTVADLDLMPDDSNRYEIIEGELYVSRAPSLTHQILVANIVADFHAFLTVNPLGLVVPGPGVIFSEYSGVIPDVIFISNERRSEIAAGERVMGAPDLVIEIVSPGAENERRDRIVKRQLYGKHGVREYWIVYPESRRIEVYVFDGRALTLANTFAEHDELTSAVLPGYRVKVEKLFAR
ncbi:MAG: Uma2 family endonuclease [Blastocatellia bacterium]